MLNAKKENMQPEKTLLPGMSWATVQGYLQMKVSFSYGLNPINTPNSVVFYSSVHSFS